MAESRRGVEILALVVAVFGFLVGAAHSVSAETTACAITPYGAIGDKWNSIGGEGGFYGCAAAAEATTADGRNGRFQYFQGGLILWHPSTGAHLVYAPIHDLFVAAGRESVLGYPVDDGRDQGPEGCRRQDFEWSHLSWCLTRCDPG